FGFTYGLYTFSINKVTVEFNPELNDDNIAPNKTAAKNPTSGNGNTWLTSAEYALIGSSLSPSKLKAIIPGKIRIAGPRIFKNAAINSPFWPSFKFFAAIARCIICCAVPQ